MKVLIAADGSIYTERMLAYLATHELWLNATHQYTVVHCVEPLSPRAGAYFEAEGRKLYYASESEQVFKPMRSFFERRGLVVNFVSQVGSPGAVLSTMAEEDGFDLVVMGSHGHGPLTGLLMGSVATKVLSLSKTPVLLVR